jgi:hypothetical protein
MHLIFTHFRKDQLTLNKLGFKFLVNTHTHNGYYKCMLQQIVAANLTSQPRKLVSNLRENLLLRTLRTLIDDILIIKL